MLCKFVEVEKKKKEIPLKIYLIKELHDLKYIYY
jgi:hypothetical protein